MELVRINQIRPEDVHKSAYESDLQRSKEGTTQLRRQKSESIREAKELYPDLIPRYTMQRNIITRRLLCRFIELRLFRCVSNLQGLNGVAYMAMTLSACFGSNWQTSHKYVNRLILIVCKRSSGCIAMNSEGNHI